MIVTSKRCYLNILTQLLDAETLLNANYYICDRKSPDGGGSMIPGLNDHLVYNEDGQLVVVERATEFNSHPQYSAISKYNISYGDGSLDPSFYLTSLLSNGISSSEMAQPVEKFIKQLNNTDTLINVYRWLFKKELRGNKLQILLYFDEDSISPFVHIVCEYLSQNFGADITFIDPQYRPNVIGKVTYTGDKMFAQQNINKIRDMELLFDFNAMISNTSSDGSMTNLTTWLNAFNCPQMIYLYNLLFPDAPLPPDNYTADHIKHIIIGRVVGSRPKNPWNNLHVSDDYFNLIKRYEDEEADIQLDTDINY